MWVYRTPWGTDGFWGRMALKFSRSKYEHAGVVARCRGSFEKQAFCGESPGGGRNQPTRLVRGALTELARRPGGLLTLPLPAGLRDGNACRVVVGSCLHRWHVAARPVSPQGEGEKRGGRRNRLDGVGGSISRRQRKTPHKTSPVRGHS